MTNAMNKAVLMNPGMHHADERVHTLNCGSLTMKLKGRMWSELIFMRNI